MAPASPCPANPSDAIASLAAAMAAFRLRDSQVLADQLDGIEVGFGPPQDWTLDASHLCENAFLAVGSIWPPPAPETEIRFAEYARALQRLDRWHAPTIPEAVDLTRTEDHEAALDRLVSGQFNTNIGEGTVIPRESPDTPFLKAEAEMDWASNPTSLAIVNSLMDVCAFLPSSVRADDPDDPNLRKTRSLQLRLVRYSPGTTPSRVFKDDVRIAVAPVLEHSTDAKLWTRGDRYSIHPSVAKEHLVAIIAQAIAMDADVLLMPEMSVDEEFLPELQKAILAQRQEYYAASSRPPSLAFVFAGILRKRHGSSFHRNYVAVLDSLGTILLEQDKLSHWNLNAANQRRFGMFGKYPVPLLEDTEPGTHITVAELPGLGRFLTLICADMSADEPGDWIGDIVGLDWVHAPIMDGSTCWTQDSTHPPWIIKRARRIAGSGSSAVVTNSIPLTHWNNEVIQRECADNPSYPFRPYAECGIALAAIRQGTSIMMQHVTEPLPVLRSPVVHVITWSSGWADMP